MQKVILQKKKKMQVKTNGEIMFPQLQRTTESRDSQVIKESPEGYCSRMMKYHKSNKGNGENWVKKVKPLGGNNSLRGQQKNQIKRVLDQWLNHSTLPVKP